MNAFGDNFRLSIFGESHGEVVGVVIDGVKQGIELAEDSFTSDIQRRKSGARGTTTRLEDDIPQILSGVFRGRTTGAPLTILFKNQNTQQAVYEHYVNVPRPSHADFVAHTKFNGFNDYRGGGHFSGRLTLPLVAAGVVAKKQIKPVDIQSKVLLVGGRTDINAAVEMAIAQHDSVGGIVECTASKVPIGLGEPFFNSIESVIAHLTFAIPGIRGIEFGAGFSAAAMSGSAHNDVFISTQGSTATNNAGGVVGGLTNGNELVFRVAVKPTASICKPQQTLNMQTGQPETLVIEGRHDACIALRVPVVLESITAIALANFIG